MSKGLNEERYRDLYSSSSKYQLTWTLGPSLNGALGTCLWVGLMLFLWLKIVSRLGSTQLCIRDRAFGLLSLHM